jgi:PKD repeat protein
MGEKKSIEQLFQKEFETFEVQPSKKVWRGVRYELFIKNFLHFSPRTINIYYMGGVLGIAAAVFITFSQPNKNNSEHVILGAKPNNPGLSDSLPTSSISVSEIEYRNTNLGSQNQPQHISLKTNPKPETGNEKPTQSPIFEKTQASDNAEFKSFNGQSVVAWFECKNPTGCAPLSASFRNSSQNAVRYLWSFGDGGSSELENPVYIFDEPGTWFISLTAFSQNNEISIFTDSIKVSPVPEARFSIDNQGLPGEDHPVYFYNYSSGADSYLWDFGDGTSSVFKDPDHYFSKKGTANIKLISYSSIGCSDSVNLKNPFKAADPVFIFPTAFSPNMSGSVTGQYSRNDPSNNVFYPYVDEEPEEYQLRVFNRSGVQIFESNDILIGWDGYYREELQSQGVYVWKARIVFSDGRSVVKMGDVTLLWGK